MLSVYWLYERNNEEWLLKLAKKMHDQGYDWSGHFADFKFKERLIGGFDMTTHVVNNAMAVKTPGVWFRYSHNEDDRKSVYQIMEMLDKYHGQVTGIFAGDEHYAGLNPSQGTELCAVVEYMFSLENLVSILGDPKLADRLERITFNALPATLSPDMWAHQYDQQANQVVCRIAEDRIYGTNGPAANIFGVAALWGCCTANMHQGWPKFTTHLWMKTNNGGLVATAYAPCEVNAKLNGKVVKASVETDYPFNDHIDFTIEVDQPSKFPLYLRIPVWADGSELQIGESDAVSTKAGTFHCIDREWKGSTSISLRLPMMAKTQRRYHNSISIERGPLVYSLKIGEYWKRVRGEEPHADWEVYPTTQWNYALDIDENHLQNSIAFESKPVGDCPFSPDGAPVMAKVGGNLIPEWIIEHNAAGVLPESPVSSTQPKVQLTLIPYGCTNLRVTEFPKLG